MKAHGDKEDYFGIPAAIIQSADGRAMEDFVTGQGFGSQPNSFDSKRIESEVSQSSTAAAGGELPDWQEPDVAEPLQGPPRRVSSSPCRITT